MAYYLQMDGVDDKVIIPAMAATEFILVMKPRPAVFKQYIYFGGKAINRNGSNNGDQYGTDYDAVYIDGVAATASNTAFVKVNVKQTMRGVLKAGVNISGTGSALYNNTLSTYMEGDLFSCQIYNGATLQASYDFTLGNVNDQSGNGRHATLTGGTWIEDGPSGTDVSYSYATKQVVYADRVTNNATVQRVYANRTVDVATLQRVYADRTNQTATLQRINADRQALASTLQRINADRSYSYAMLQVITDSDGTNVSYSYAMRQVINADRQYTAATRQQIYALQSAMAAMRQVIYSDTVIPHATRQRISTNRVYVYPLRIRIYDPDAPVYVQTVNIDIEIRRSIEVTVQIQRSIEVSAVIARSKEFTVYI